MQALGALIETVQMAGHAVKPWPYVGVTASGRVLLMATLVGERKGRGADDLRGLVGAAASQVTMPHTVSRRRAAFAHAMRHVCPITARPVHVWWPTYLCGYTHVLSAGSNARRGSDTDLAHSN